MGLAFVATVYTTGAPMVVMWCRECGALLGVCEPHNDWSTVRDGLCPACAERNPTNPATTQRESEKAAETVDDLPTEQRKSGQTADTVDDLPTDQA
jgi:hypothetical protein